MIRVRSSRRRFLALTVPAMLLTPARSTTAPATARSRTVQPGPDAGSIPIIDTHQHVWEIGKFRLPPREPGSPLLRDFLMADYVKAAAGLNIVKSIYVEMMVDPRQQVEEAEYALSICRRADSPMAGAVIAGDPASPRFPDYIRRFRQTGYIKGVRHSMRRALSKPLDPALVRGLRLLGEAGLSFDLLLGPPQLRAAAALADACPATGFALNHCGNVDLQAPDRTRWERDIAELASRANVICKVSGIVSSSRPAGWTAADLAPVVEHVRQVFGPDRVVFGSDWPRCTLRATLRQWVEALQSIVRDEPADTRRKLFHDNAARFYRLG